MKRTLIIATLAIMSLFGTTACAQKKGENMNSLNNKKVLVAYFSWSGNTKAAADYITQKLNADQFEIVREAEACLRAAGFHRVRLAISADNPQATHFWKKSGYVTIRELTRDGLRILEAEHVL